jgi:hypothetical protein
MVMLAWAVALSGCANHPYSFDQTPPKPQSAPKPAAKSKGKLIVTPEFTLKGRVISYNEPLRFAVLNFPVGQMPAVDQTLFVYRNNLKVGELKVTGPQRDDNIVADLVAGEAAAGDEISER